MTEDETPTTVVALVADLMDQSRIRTAFPGVRFIRDADAAAGADVVIVDLARAAAQIAPVRAATRGRIIAFGPHVDEAAFAVALGAGADVVVPRSQFFRDPAAVVTGG